MTERQTDKQLAAFFEASLNEKHKLPDHARTRILLEAEQLQAKPRHVLSEPSLITRIVNFWTSVPAGAALASLFVGLFVGFLDPDSVSALTNLDGLLGSLEDGGANGDFLNGSAFMIMESESL